MFELVRREGVVAGDEGEVVGKVGRVRTLVRHVARCGFVLFTRFEGNGEVEAAAGDFGGGEVAEAVFEAAEVRDEFVAGEGEAVVEDGKGSTAADGIGKVSTDAERGLRGVQRGFEGRNTAAVVKIEMLEAILDDEMVISALAGLISSED